MTDLVERLRSVATGPSNLYSNTPNALLREAAAALDNAKLRALAPINADMPAQQLRLHMGDLTASELRVARAAIRWANAAAQAQAAEVRRETVEECAKIAGLDANWSAWRRASKKDWKTGDEKNLFHVPTNEAVMAYRHGIAVGAVIAAAIRALTDAAKEPDHLPDAGNMIDRPERDQFPDDGEMVQTEEDRV